MILTKTSGWFYETRPPLDVDKNDHLIDVFGDWSIVVTDAEPSFVYGSMECFRPEKNASSLNHSGRPHYVLWRRGLNPYVGNPKFINLARLNPHQDGYLYYVDRWAFSQRWFDAEDFLLAVAGAEKIGSHLYIGGNIRERLGTDRIKRLLTTMMVQKELERT